MDRFEQGEQSPTSPQTKVTFNFPPPTAPMEISPSATPMNASIGASGERRGSSYSKDSDLRRQMGNEESSHSLPTSLHLSDDMSALLPNQSPKAGDSTSHPFATPSMANEGGSGSDNSGRFIHLHHDMAYSPESVKLPLKREPHVNQGKQGDTKDEENLTEQYREYHRQKFLSSRADGALTFGESTASDDDGLATRPLLHGDRRYRSSAADVYGSSDADTAGGHYEDSFEGRIYQYESYRDGSINHKRHALLCLLTCGLWTPIWICACLGACCQRPCS